MLKFVSKEDVKKIEELKLEGVKTCEYCYNYFHSEDMIELDGKMYCKSCYERVASKCIQCGNMKHNSKMYKVYKDYMNYDVMCYDCLKKLENDGLIFTCYNCNKYYYMEYIGKDTGNYKYCKACDLYRNNERVYMDKLENYHQNNDFYIMKGKDEILINDTLTLGFELETEEQDENYEKALYVSNIIRKNYSWIKCEHDGSLDDSGVEYISQPFTLQWLSENQKEVIRFLKTLANNGIISHNSKNCGLHIHIGKNYFKSVNEIDKLIYIFQKNSDKLVRFSRRSSSELHWCSFYNSQGDNVTLKYVKDTHRGDSSRYRVVNTTNPKTVEVRLFKGTLNYITFFACIELVVTLCKLAKSHRALNSLNWEIIANFKGNAYLKEYIKERGLI